jgi:hypothetical protein
VYRGLGMVLLTPNVGDGVIPRRHDPGPGPCPRDVLPVRIKLLIACCRP